MSSSDLKSIAAGILNSSTTSGTSGASTTNDLSSSASNLIKTIETSFLDNIQYIIIAIVICVVIGGVLLFGTPILLKVLKKNKTDMNNTLNSTGDIPSNTKGDIPSNIKGDIPSNTKGNIPNSHIKKHSPSIKHLSTAIKNYKNMRIGQ
jgi:type IV secretory pathway VirB2 component (pilin)